MTLTLFWLNFKDGSMFSGNVTHCRCLNREKMVQTENGWERIRMDENGSKLNTKKTSCYKILARKYVNT